jgi:hypothetical protein
MMTSREHTPRAGSARHRRRRQANLYRRLTAEVDPAMLAAAARAEGLDDEVAIVRVLLGRHLADHPENLELTIKGMHLLVRMVTAQHQLSGADAAELNERVDQVARHFAAAVFGQEVADG